MYALEAASVFRYAILRDIFLKNILYNVVALISPQSIILSVA